MIAVPSLPLPTLAVPKFPWKTGSSRFSLAIGREVAFTWSFRTRRFNFNPGIERLRQLLERPDDWTPMLPIDLVSGAYDNRTDPSRVLNDVKLLAFKHDFERAIREEADDDGVLEFEFRVHTRAGGSETEQPWLLLRAILETDDRGRAIAIRGRILDISGPMRRGMEAERRAIERGLAAERDAKYDSLTGLLRKGAFDTECRRLMVRQPEDGGLFVFVFIDLNRFKPINDSLGHQAGDVVLAELGERLHRVAGDGVLAGRLGGDEFALMARVRGAFERGELIQQAVEAANFLCTLPDSRVPVVSIEASVGVASAAPGELSYEELQGRADKAMYQAKRGRWRAAEYDPGYLDQVRERMAADSVLRSALEQDAIGQMYMPIVSTSTYRFVGAEMLIDPDVPGLDLGSAAIIRRLEETRLILEHDPAALRGGCRQMAEWRDRFGPDLTLHANISPLLLARPELPDEIEAILAEAGLPPEALVLEVTEGRSFRGSDTARSSLIRLVQLGVKIGIDDYGVDYSNHERVRELEMVSRVKLDGLFAQQATEGSNKAAAVAHTIMSLQAMKKAIVAERVRTFDQFRFFSRFGCDVQGDYVGAKVPADTLTIVFDEGNLVCLQAAAAMEAASVA